MATHFLPGQRKVILIEHWSIKIIQYWINCMNTPVSSPPSSWCAWLFHGRWTWISHEFIGDRLKDKKHENLAAVAGFDEQKWGVEKFQLFLLTLQKKTCMLGGYRLVSMDRWRLPLSEYADIKFGTGLLCQIDETAWVPMTMSNLVRWTGRGIVSWDNFTNQKTCTAIWPK